MSLTSTIAGALTLRRGLAAGIIVTVLAAAVLALGTAAELRPPPATLDVGAAADPRPRFTDRNGIPLNATYETNWNVHDRLPLHEIPPFLRLAFIHAEDKRFYQHSGPDWIARLAALATNLRHLDSIRGASTITEQVVRMLRPRPRTVWSRWLEGFEASALERRFGKDEILEFYLNQVPFASERRGVRQAAELYFARDLDTLSDREMLALAVLVRSPSRLDLRRDIGASAAAIARLADAMLERQAIDASRHRAVFAHAVELEPARLAVEAPHFLRFAALVARERPAATTVATTLDASLQAVVQRLTDARVASLESLGVGSAAVLVADNDTGGVLAWVVAGGGSTSVPFSHIDPITTPRQPGSALKPLLYALALEKGRSVADVVVDAPLAEIVGRGLHRYRNYSERHYGPVTLRTALANSLNIPALKLLHEIQPASYLERLRDFGITSLTRHPDFYGDGLALGNGELTLYELVEAYLVLANRGRARRLGVLRDDLEPLGPAVVSAETASLIADVLSDADARAAEFGRDSVLALPVQTAVKTGTSSDYRDAWAVGYDARFTVGVWMGNLDQTPTNGVTGSIGPALLLRSVFARLNRDGETRPLYMSPSLTRREVCVPSPGLAAGDCLTRDEWFDPAHVGAAIVGAETQIADPSAEPTAGPIPTIRLHRPTDDLELAIDPRIPAESQAFEFRLDGVGDDDQVAWIIDGRTEQARGERYRWRVTRGTHRVAARVSRDGILIAEPPAVEFRVR